MGKNPFPPASAEEVARLAPALSALAELGDPSFALTLAESFNLVQLTTDDRRYFDGPVIYNTVGGWAEELPAWLSDAIRQERLEMAVGMHPGWLVSASEIIAVLYGVTHCGPVRHDVANLYAWAMSYALTHRREPDGTPNPVKREDFWRDIHNDRVVADSDVLSSNGKLHKVYRDTADEIRRAVVNRRGTRFVHQPWTSAPLPLQPGRRSAPAMKPKTVSIPSEVAAVLASSTCDGNILKLPQQLDRPLYEATDKVLKALGAKWNRHRGGHVFPADAAALIAQALGDGSVIDRKKTLQIFETPPELAARMAGMIPTGMRVLEPSAGSGRLVKEALLQGAAAIDAVEIDPNNALSLLGIAAGDKRVKVVHGDFLSHVPLTKYDAVLMNPPFRNGQDIAHVMRAYEQLRPGGHLVAVMSEGTFHQQIRRATDFRDWLRSVKSETETLPAGLFQQEGTGVPTRLIEIRKP